MLYKLTKLFKIVFGNKIYNFVKSLILNVIKFFNLKKLNYNVKKDLEFNENILSKIFEGYDKYEISKLLNLRNLSYFDENISWHYHLFSCLQDNVKNILEIGTFKGEFTNYLAELYPSSKISTIDLKKEDEQFKNTYNRNSFKNLSEYIKIRDLNLKKENINFIEMDSFNLIECFQDIKFDAIWIDGDHIDPQVTIDIFSAYKLLSKNGILVCDDVVKDSFKTEYVNNDSYNTLNFFEKKKLIKNSYILKRVTRENYINKKYISISQKIH